MQKNTTVVIAAVLGFCVLSSVGYFGYSHYEGYRYTVLMKEGNVAKAKGLADQAVTDFSGAASIAPGAQDELTADWQLATSLFVRRQSGDFVRAVSLLAKIVSDSHASAQLRSQAYVTVASMYSAGGTNFSALRNGVFTVSPFSRYYSSAGGNLTKATKLLYQKANDLAPSAAAYFGIAEVDAVLINMLGAHDPSDPAQLQTAKDLYQAIQAGDALLAQSSTLPAQMGQIYIQRSLALGVASYYLPQVTNQMVDSAYDKAITYLGAASTTNSVALLTEKLTYAASMESREPGVNDAKVKQLLQDFVTGAASNSNVNAIVLAIRSYKPGTPILVVMPRLAKLSPIFSAYLAKLGWNVTASAG